MHLRYIRVNTANDWQRPATYVYVMSQTNEIELLHCQSPRNALDLNHESIFHTLLPSLQVAERTFLPLARQILEADEELGLCHAQDKNSVTERGGKEGKQASD